MPAMPLPTSMFASSPSIMNGSGATFLGASANIAGHNANTSQEAPSSFSNVLKQKTETKAPDAPPASKQANSPNSSDSTQASQPSQSSQPSGQPDNQAQAHHEESDSNSPQQGSKTSIMATLLGLKAEIALKPGSNTSQEESETTSLAADANGQAMLAALLAQQQIMPYDRKLSDDGANPGARQALLSDAMQTGTEDRALADFAALAEKTLMDAHSDASLRPAEGSDNNALSLSFDQTFAAANARIMLNEQGGATQTSGAAVTSYNVNTPVGARGWDLEVGNKLVWMAGKQEQNAELVLHPPQLGRVEVSIHMKGDQVSTTFVAAHPVARDALENALPRLREMFADAGLSLGQAHVGSDSGDRQTSAQHENNARSSRFSHEITALEEGNMPIPRTMSAWQHQGRGLVDTFA